MYKLKTYLKIYLQVKMRWKIESFGQLHIPEHPQVMYQGKYCLFSRDYLHLSQSERIPSL